MFETIAAIREFLAGKKTYLTAIAGLITVIVAWSTGELTGLQFAQSAFVLLQTMFIRAGIAKI